MDYNQVEQMAVNKMKKRLNIDEAEFDMEPFQYNANQLANNDTKSQLNVPAHTPAQAAMLKQVLQQVPAIPLQSKQSNILFTKPSLQPHPQLQHRYTSQSPVQRATQPRSGMNTEQLLAARKAKKLTNTSSIRQTITPDPTTM